MKKVALLIALLLHGSVALLVAWGEATNRSEGSRTITVRDVVEMTTLGHFLYRYGHPSRGLVALFSPDRSKFIVIVRKGNVNRNTTEYSLVMWKTAGLFNRHDSVVLLKMSSSSNRPAIERLTWVNNHLVAFLGESPGELHQLYTFNLRTHSLKQLSHHPTNLLAYSMAANANRIAYGAEPPETRNRDEQIARYGLHVLHQDLYKLLEGKLGPPETANDQLFIQDRERRPRQLHTIGAPILFFDNLALSPDGRSLIVLTYALHVPAIWQQYAEPWIQVAAKEQLPPGRYSTLAHYELINTEANSSRLLLNSPYQWHGLPPDVAWSPSGEWVLLTKMFLPLNGVEGKTLEARRSASFIVCVKVKDGTIEEVARGQSDYRLQGWGSGERSLRFEIASGSSEGHDEIVFLKENGTWVKTESQGQTLPQIVLEESMSIPPKIYAINPKTKTKTLICDLNPTFASLAFGKVEEIRWKATDGVELKGGLYYPPHFVPGKKYPLVIQTHGWEPDRFRMDGPYSTSFAARPLAGKGILVLQVPDDFAGVEGTPKEAEHQVATFRGAVQYLESKGLIDVSHIGLMGFSRTCLAVKYALIHSDLPITAASVTDGFDGGYVPYILLANSSPIGVQTFEGVNGGMPWGETAQAWARNSLSSHLDMVTSPILITALYPGSLLSEWEWLSGLARLGKPVDMLYIPDGTHLLEKPWEILTSEQATVDWFRFWLQDDEDSDPKKRAVYERWRYMRTQISSNPR